MAHDYAKKWEYENNFYLTCDPSRLGKITAHLELYKKIIEVPGVVAEFGVFKGASFSRFCIFRELFEAAESRKIIGFDTFSDFPDTGHKEEQTKRNEFIKDAGTQSISKAALTQSLAQRGLDKNVELVEGDICHTLPAYLDKHPETRFALVNMDVDLYEPSRVILKHVWERMVQGGVLILDDYSIFPGETKAVEEILGKAVNIRKFSYALKPYYLIKEN